MTDLSACLVSLYGGAATPRLLERVYSLLAEYRPRIRPASPALTESDSILITYGDMVQSPGEKPLRTLSRFCREQLSGVVSGIHILPFYPWTSDDGFSVTDYRQVDPNLGGWEDVSAMQDHFRLMFDGVINHISSQSDWFQGFLRDDPRYFDYFIAVEGSPDLSQVVRPRTLPLLTEFTTPSGSKRVWTTFSTDQIDLDFRNPKVLLEILDILLMYAARGASFIRLDAIAYLWKQIGTSCIHLPQTHEVIRFLRAALDKVAPHVHLITETNVPHADNISYFGDGCNEAQLVYNFALPPLILHVFRTGDARTLSEWAKTLTLPSASTTFFNFLASHDGIGLNPVRGILSTAEIDLLVEDAVAHGGLISHKNNPDGSKSPYEMNINYFDALSDAQGTELLDRQASRFLAAQAVMLTLIGVPGIYFHSLFGSRGWLEGVQQTGRSRMINRQKCQYDGIMHQLADGESLRAKVFGRYKTLLLTRRSEPAFHPHGSQVVLDLHPAVFAVERTAPGGSSRVLCLQNVSGQKVALGTKTGAAYDLFTGRRISMSNLILDPYQILWVKR